MTTEQQNIYILAFGPHPDDVDMGCGWTLYKTSKQGKSNVIIDLSDSCMSTRGNPTLRQQEAQQAGEALGVTKRENLCLEDFTLRDTDEYRKIIVRKIREYRPEIIMLPNFKDRHPDHEGTALLIKNAIFASGLVKYETGQEPYRPRLALEYMIWDQFDPSLIIGLSNEEYNQKILAFQSFNSQNATNAWADGYIRGRSQTLGRKIGFSHGEGFRLVESEIGMENFDSILTRSF